MWFIKKHTISKIRCRKYKAETCTDNLTRLKIANKDKDSKFIKKDKWTKTKKMMSSIIKHTVSKIRYRK